MESMDLEEWRRQERLTYDELALLIGCKSKAGARFYAVGYRWPQPEIIEHIRKITGQKVTVEKLHDRRCLFMRENGIWREVNLAGPVNIDRDIRERRCGARYRAE